MGMGSYIPWWPRDFERLDSAAVCARRHRGAPPALVVMKIWNSTPNDEPTFSRRVVVKKRLSVSVVAL